MINVSSEFKRALLSDQRVFSNKATITLLDGTVLNIGSNDIMQGSVKYSDSVSSSGNFDIGTAIINSYEVKLQNMYEKFSMYDFDGATVIPFVGLELSSGVEWIQKGVYSVESAAYATNVITLRCEDNMRKFDVDFPSEFSFPTTLNMLLRNICSYCGVSYLTTSLNQGSYTIQRVDASSLNCRDMISYIAQIEGAFARFNNRGLLEIKWYATEAFGKENNYMDGGRLDDHATGDTADGGNFKVYAAADAYDGGTFADTSAVHHIFSYTSPDIGTDDVVITGVQVNIDIEGGGVETYGAGGEGYILSIAKNVLITSNTAQSVVNYLSSRIVGMRFRPLKAQVLCDPSREAGDPFYFTDIKSNSHECYFTNIETSIGGHQTISCDAKSPIRNSASQYSAITQAIVRTRREMYEKINAEKSVWEKAIEDLGDKLASANGLYTTVEQTSSGSVFYMHEKPALSESKIVWKMTAEAWGVSTDGGKTWNGGMTVDGDVITRILKAEGVNAEWVNVTDLSSFNATIGDWSVGKTQIVKIIDLYTDMTSAGLSGVASDAAVQYHIWMRAPVDANTAAFFIGYKRKDDYLGGVNAIYPYFRARADGSVYCTNFTMAGGSINVTAATSSTSVIGMKFGNLSSSFRAGGIDIYDATGGTNIDAGQVVLNTSGTRIVMNSSNFSCDPSAIIKGRLDVYGGKYRLVESENYGDLRFSAYETTSPYFGDIGQGTISETGSCCIFFDPDFQEAVITERSYQVFLQKEGPGDLWVAEKADNYFVVKGAPGLYFAWEAKAKQRGYDQERLYITEEVQKDVGYVEAAETYISNFEKELIEYEENN